MSLMIVGAPPKYWIFKIESPKKKKKLYGNI